MVDIKKKYVRLTGIRDSKYVEFDFSIDDPEIFVELILPYDMFQSFCETNQVEKLPPRGQAQDDYDQLLWRVGGVRETMIKN